MYKTRFFIVAIFIVFFMSHFFYGARQSANRKKINNLSIADIKRQISFVKKGYFDAAQKLFMIGKKCVPYVLPLLKHYHPRVQSLAILVLGELRDKRATMALIPLLEDSVVRKSVIQALGRIKDKRAVPALLKLLKKYEVNDDLIMALGNIKARRAVPHLLQLLNNGIYNRRIFEALGKIKDERAFWPIVKCLDKKKLLNVSIVANTLALYKDKRATPFLLKALKNAEETVAWSIIRALGTIGDCRAVSTLISLTKKHTEESLAALGKIKNRRALPVVIKALKNEDEYIRTIATKVLGQLGDRRAIPVLRAILKDKNEVLSVYARVSLLRLTGKDWQAVWIKLLNSNDLYLRSTAAFELGDCKGKRVVDALCKNMDLGAVVFNSLGKIKDKRSIPALVRASKYKFTARYIQDFIFPALCAIRGEALEEHSLDQ